MLGRMSATSEAHIFAWTAKKFSTRENGGSRDVESRSIPLVQKAFFRLCASARAGMKRIDGSQISY